MKEEDKMNVVWRKDRECAQECNKEGDVMEEGDGETSVGRTR
jgi:hypothetical protein